MSKHTPGPWRVQADPDHGDNHPNHESRYVTYGPGEFDEEWHIDRGSGIICSMRDTECIKADAQLIATAPDLLAFAESVAAWLVAPDLDRSVLSDFQQRAFALIAKAGCQMTGKVRVVPTPRFTEYHFGPMSAIAGKELDVQDPVDSAGKIACWVPCGQHLVFVDQRDVAWGETIE